MEHTGATPRIFISYSHDDETWKDRVVSQLGVLEHEGLLSVWDDRRINAGDEWLPEIETAIKSCNVALLLMATNLRRDSPVGCVLRTIVDPAGRLGIGA